jgi:hypothetical protein
LVSLTLEGSRLLSFLERVVLLGHVQTIFGLVSLCVRISLDEFQRAGLQIVRVAHGAPVGCVLQGCRAPKARSLIFPTEEHFVDNSAEPGRYKVEFTAGQVMHDTLERLKDLMRHQVPNGDIAVILERAAKLLLEKTLKERFAQTNRPRPRAINVAASHPEARARPNTTERRMREANVQPTREHAPAHSQRAAIASPERLPQTRSQRDASAPGAINPCMHPPAPHSRSRTTDGGPMSSSTHRPELRSQSDTDPQRTVSSMSQPNQPQSRGRAAGPCAIASSTHTREPHPRSAATEPQARAQTDRAASPESRLETSNRSAGTASTRAPSTRPHHEWEVVRCRGSVCTSEH